MSEIESFVEQSAHSELMVLFILKGCSRKLSKCENERLNGKVLSRDLKTVQEKFSQTILSTYMYRIGQKSKPQSVCVYDVNNT